MTAWTHNTLLASKLDEAKEKRQGMVHRGSKILHGGMYHTGEPSDIVENEVFSTESAPIELASHRSLSLS